MRKQELRAKLADSEREVAVLKARIVDLNTEVANLILRAQADEAARKAPAKPPVKKAVKKAAPKKKA